MIRVAHLFWATLFVGLVITLFQVKITVQQLGDERDATVGNIHETRERIRQLELEWTQLNQPRRLTKLSHDFLTGFEESRQGTIAPVDAIPVRPEDMRPVMLLTIDEAANARLNQFATSDDEASRVGSLRPIHAPDLIESVINQSGRNSAGSE